MKILRIIARLNVGGPARQVIWLTEGLQSADYETLLVAGRVPTGEDDMSYLAEAAGVKPLIFPEMSREISAKDALTIWKLYRLMARERPDIVHTHTAKAGTTGRIAGLMYRWLTPGTLIGQPRACRFVHTYHGHVFHSYYGPLKTRFFLRIERLLAQVVTDSIVVVSEQQRREIHETFRVGRGEKFVVIPLGIDLSAYACFEERRPRARAELGAREDDILVGIVGRLTEIKNHRMFLQAAACYKALAASPGAPRVRFMIIGDGNLRRELKEVARKLGVEDCVTFLGTRRDPENFYPALDVVALTSLNEGTPLTLVEAMANARPVIATAVGGVVDLVGQPIGLEAAEARYTVCERGILVRPRDCEAFALCLARLIRDQQMRLEMGQRGRDYILRHYTKERLLTDIAALYETLIKRKRLKEPAKQAEEFSPSRGEAAPWVIHQRATGNRK